MSQQHTISGRRPALIWLSILIVLILLVAVLIIVLFIYPNYQRQQQVEQHYQAGVAFQDVGDWDKAVEAFERVVAIDATYKDTRTRLAEVKSKQQEVLATMQAKASQATATAQAQAAATAAAATVEAKIAQVTSVAATTTAQARATLQAQESKATATAEALIRVEAHYQKGLAYMNLERWEEAKAELEQVFEVYPNYKEVHAKLAEVEAEIAKLIPTVTPSPLATNTLTPPAATATPRPEDRHPGEVNLLKSNQSLPAGWFTNGEFTYWEGFLHLQDEPFIDVTVENCGDDEGNGRLDIVQIFDPEGELVVNEQNLNGDQKFRIRTYQKPGYYRVFLQDNDTGTHNGNGGTLIVEMLKDQMIYLNP